MAYSNSQNQSQSTGYYNPIYRSLGWARNARYVDGHKGEPFYAVNLVCPRGPHDKYETTYVQAIVKGEKTIEIFEQYFDAINDPDTRVTIVSNIGDLRPDSYEDKDGNLCHFMRGSLICIHQVLINGEVDYKAERENQDDGQQQQADKRSSRSQPARKSQSKAQPARNAQSAKRQPAKRSASRSQNNRSRYPQAA